MRKRDFLKKKAKQTGDPLIWQQYKHSRNSTNNEIKSAKSQYFKVNLEANKNSTELAVELDEKYTRAPQMVCVPSNC